MLLTGISAVDTIACMMSPDETEKAIARLKRIEGQVRGLQKMVAEERYCLDIVAQTRSVAAALRGVENLVLENHLNTCVADAMKSPDEEEQRKKVAEVMAVIAQTRKSG